MHKTRTVQDVMARDISVARSVTVIRPSARRVRDWAISSAVNATEIPIPVRYVMDQSTTTTPPVGRVRAWVLSGTVSNVTAKDMSRVLRFRRTVSKAIRCVAAAVESTTSRVPIVSDR